MDTKKTEIQEAFLKCVYDHNSLDINISEICRYAFCARSTFYAYYRNTNEVLEEIKNKMDKEYRFKTNISNSFKDNMLSLLELVRIYQSFFQAYFSVRRSDKRIQLLYTEKTLKNSLASQFSGVSNESLLYITVGTEAVISDWIQSGCVLPTQKLAITISETICKICSPITAKQ